MRNDEGFTLVELLIVIAIIGLIAAIAIPFLLNALERARQAATLSDVMELGKSVERYIVDHPKYGAPRVNDISLLRQTFEELEINTGKVRIVDGWGLLLRYSFGGDEAPINYTVESAGSDGEFSGLLDNPIDGEYIITHFEEDIIWSKGRFIQYPIGAQESGGSQ